MRGSAHSSKWITGCPSPKGSMLSPEFLPLRAATQLGRSQERLVASRTAARICSLRRIWEKPKGWRTQKITVPVSWHMGAVWSSARRTFSIMVSRVLAARDPASSALRPATRASTMSWGIRLVVLRIISRTGRVRSRLWGCARSAVQPLGRTDLASTAAREVSSGIGQDVMRTPIGW